MARCRQRHPNGQQELLDQLKRHFDLGDALEATEKCALCKSCRHICMACMRMPKSASRPAASTPLVRHHG